ncbi:MAG: tyrosine-type recombinase/integrase [Opitutales bacterium]
MPAKDTASYWKTKVTRRKIAGKVSSHFYARFSHEGRQGWINLNTGNATTAANTAAEKYQILKADGWEALKPSKLTGDTITVGEWIMEVEALRMLRKSTLDNYTRKLRQIAGEIKNIGDSRKYSAKGGSAAWIAQVDKVKLSELTTERVKKWKSRRLQAVAEADEDEVKRAVNTVNSILRNVKAVFGRRILAQVDVKFTEVPFSGVSVGSPVIAPFQSEVDLDSLIAKAAEELDEDLHLIFLLAAGCGLRRSEIDRLRRQDVDLDAGTIKIVSTEDGKVKTQNSVRTLNITKGGPVHAALSEYRLGFHAVCPENKRKIRKAERYRCDDEFQRLSTWLRGHGIVKAIQPIHYLRKAFGDRVASRHGIDIAAISLGDSIEMAHKVYNSHNKTRSIL